MASLQNLTFILFALVCLLTSGFCDDDGSGDGSGTDGSGTSGSGTEAMFTDVTEVVTEVVTDAEDGPSGTTDFFFDVAQSDIQAFELAVTNEFTAFTLDVDNIVTYSVTIKNVGDVEIAAGSEDLYDLVITLSDMADPTSSAATTQDITPLLTSTTNLDSGIAGGASITLENVHTMINIATDQCSTYDGGYVCVQISKASGATYDDDSTTNNYYCLTFGEVSDGFTGTLECSACVVKMSLFALILSTLLAYLSSS